MQENSKTIILKMVTLESLEHRIDTLCKSYNLPNDEHCLRFHAMAVKAGFKHPIVVRVPSDYYDRTLEERVEYINTHASSPVPADFDVNCLCKSLVLKNSKWTPQGEYSDELCPQNSKYYFILIQYNRIFISQRLFIYVRSLKENSPQKYYNFRSASEEEAVELTGFAHNGMTPLGSKVSIPLVIDEEMLKLPYICFGAGHEDVKIIVPTSEFMEVYKPYVCAYSKERDE